MSEPCKVAVLFPLALSVKFIKDEIMNIFITPVVAFRRIEIFKIQTIIEIVESVFTLWRRGNRKLAEFSD